MSQGFHNFNQYVCMVGRCTKPTARCSTRRCANRGQCQAFASRAVYRVPIRVRWAPQHRDDRTLPHEVVTRPVGAAPGEGQ